MQGAGAEGQNAITMSQVQPNHQYKVEKLARVGQTPKGVGNGYQWGNISSEPRFQDSRFRISLQCPMGQFSPKESLVTQIPGHFQNFELELLPGIGCRIGENGAHTQGSKTGSDINSFGSLRDILFPKRIFRGYISVEQGGPGKHLWPKKFSPWLGGFRNSSVMSPFFSTTFFTLGS